MKGRDNSMVFELATLDREHAARVNPELPRLFESDEAGIVQFKDRVRSPHGPARVSKALRLDPVSGERLAKYLLGGE
jgi:hypothetical protein